MSQNLMADAERVISNEIAFGNENLMGRLLDRFSNGNADWQYAFAAALAGRVAVSAIRRAA